MSMRWQRLGQIFDTASHPVEFAPEGFAQSPQACVMADRVRIYFSCRSRDGGGKFLSQVAFVDFDLGLRDVLAVSREPVIALGGLGHFDEHGIFPFNVLADGDRILAFTTGWNRRASVPTDAAIGLALSTDGGIRFEKVGAGPVLAPGLHEPFLVGDAFVLRVQQRLHMWYVHGARWIVGSMATEPERVYKIAHAVSDDGLAWRRQGRPIVPDRLGPDECQALPTVIEHEGVHHMLFCFRQATDFRSNRDRAYRLGHAWSSDLVTWQRDDSQWTLDRPQAGWDSQMMCYPHLFRLGSQIHLLYNGNQFGRGGFGLARLEKA